MDDSLISKFVDDPESLSEEELSALLSALREDAKLAASLKTHLKLNELLSRRSRGRRDLLAQVAYRVEEEEKQGAPLDAGAIKLEAERRRGRLDRPAFPSWILGLAAALLFVLGALSLVLTQGPREDLASAWSPEGTVPVEVKIPLHSATGTPTPSARGTPTPSATGTPTPSATGTPTPSATGAPTPSATGAPTPRATSAPSVTPTPPLPTPVSLPTPTPEPLQTPGPGPEPRLTPTPSPEPTPGEPALQPTPPARPASEGRGPRVLSVAGRVRVVEEGSPERDLVVGAMVSAAQTLIADPGASAKIAFSDSTTLALAEGASLRVLRSPKRVVLEGGTLVAEVAKQDRDMVLETPHAEVRVLGTRFVLDARKSATRLEVNEGRVRLKSRSSRRSIEVSGGEYAQAARGLRLVSRPLRASQGLLALYAFDEGRGSVIQDRSGRQDPLNLKIESPAAVSWLPRGGLQLRRPAQIVSERPAKGIVEGAVAAQALTLEAWVQPSQARVRGDEIRRMVTLSLGYDDKNFQFGQLADAFAGLVRPNLGPATYDQLSSARKSARQRLTHVVFTRDPSELRLYVNGVQSASKPAAGDLGTWDRRFFLRLGNERPGAPEADSGATAWLGTYYLVAVYGRALSRAEVERNFESRF